MVHFNPCRSGVTWEYRPMNCESRARDRSWTRSKHIRISNLTHWNQDEKFLWSVTFGIRRSFRSGLQPLMVDQDGFEAIL